MSQTDLEVISAVDVPAKKERKRSETRTLYGATAIKELSAKVLNSLSSTVEFNERVTKIALALNVSEKNAREMLKSSEGISDTYLLRKYLRMAFMRSDLCTNAIAMCRIAEIISENINEGNEVISREALKTQAAQENPSDATE